MAINQIPKRLVVTIPRLATDKVRLISFKPDDNTILKSAIVEMYFQRIPESFVFGQPNAHNLRIELHGSSNPTASSKIAESSIINMFDISGYSYNYIAQIRFDFNSSTWPGLHLQNGKEYHLFGCVDDFQPDNNMTYFSYVHDWSDIHNYRDEIDFGQELKFYDSKMPIKTALFGIKSGVTYNL